jgi:MFS family permease
VGARSTGYRRSDVRIPCISGVFIGVGLWGLHLGFSQGLLSAFVADTAPEDMRGTAFGLFNLLTGGALLVASVIAGWLWHDFGPKSTFVAGAVFSALAALFMAIQMTGAQVSQLIVDGT